MTILTDVGAYDYEELESVDPGVRHRWKRGVRLLEEIADQVEGKTERTAFGLAAQAARSAAAEPPNGGPTVSILPQSAVNVR